MGAESASTASMVGGWRRRPEASEYGQQWPLGTPTRTLQGSSISQRSLRPRGEVYSFNPILTMSRAKLAASTAALIGIALILGLATTGTGVYQFVRSRRIRADLEFTSKRYEADQLYLRALARNSEAMGKKLAELQMEVDRLNSVRAVEGAGAAAKAAAPKRPPAETRAEWEQLETTFPEVHDMLADVHRAQIGRQYGLLFAKAGLSQDQIGKFVSMAVNLYDQTETMSPMGFHPGVNELPEDQVRAILGDQAFQQYLDYNRMTGANFFAVGVMDSTGYAGAQLSLDQQTALAQIVAANSPNYQNGQRVDLSSVDWTSAETQAQSLLSPAQWKAAQGVFANYQYQVALFQAQRGQSAIPSAGPAGK